MQRVRFFAGDLIAVLLFTLVGRLAHDHGLDPVGIATTAWPFLVALVAGWAVVVGRGGDGDRLLEGAALWLGTLAFGMLIRSRAGGSVEASFIAVAGTFLAATMIGGRWLAAWVRRRRGN